MSIPEPDALSISTEGYLAIPSHRDLVSNRASPKNNHGLSRLIRSRRRRYLKINPSYFTSASSDLELADPLSYDRFIRQHQSAAEREAEGKNQGWAKTLESSLLRGEARLAEVNPDGEEFTASASQRPDWSIEDLNGDAEEATSQAEAKCRGEESWRALLANRFIAGEDEEFDYAKVDDDDRLDADSGVAGGWVERAREEEWFEQEEGSFDKNGGHLDGETGVQDY